MPNRDGRYRAVLGGLAALFLLGAAPVVAASKPQTPPQPAPGPAEPQPNGHEGMTTYERESLAVDRAANSIAKSANAINEAQRDYGFWQLILGAFGVAFTGVAAFFAWRATHWAKEAAGHTKRSADADNLALNETREAAQAARTDAVAADRRFKAQMDKNQELVEFTAKTAYAMEHAATANKGVAAAMRESATAAMISAKANQQLADAAILANNTTRKQLRAYVQLEEATISPLLIGESSEVLVIFKNSGATPAYDLTSWVATRSMDGGEVPDQPTQDEIGPLSKSPLGPGETKPVRLKLATTQPNLLDRFKRGETTLFVFGEITFRDVFDEPRYFRFRLYHDRTRAPGALGTHPEGNEAN